jgi:sporulation protein YlmC with PRC-barrel domain
MDNWRRQLLGCRVTNADSGELLGRVRSVLLDTTGETAKQLLIEMSGFQTTGTVPTENLLGTRLFDAYGNSLGEIVDLRLSIHDGQPRELVVEKRPGYPEVIPLDAGIHWQDDRWVLSADFMGRFPKDTQENATPMASDDWMVGQLAQARLLDSAGHVILEPGQVITLNAVEQASRAGVLHRLEAKTP